MSSVEHPPRRGAAAILSLAGACIVLAALHASRNFLAPILLGAFMAGVTAPLLFGLRRRGWPGWLALISALAIVDDVRQAVTMDLKRADSSLYIVGETRRELGGSAYLKLAGRRGNEVPQLPPKALEIHRRMHEAVRDGLCRSVHDCSEGGIAVAAAEMAFAGDVGLEVDLGRVAEFALALPDDRIKVAESGIHGPEHVFRLHRAGYHAFLVGEHLVRSDDPERAVRRLIGQHARYA